MKGNAIIMLLVDELWVLHKLVVMEINMSDMNTMQYDAHHESVENFLIVMLQ